MDITFTDIEVDEEDEDYEPHIEITSVLYVFSLFTYFIWF